MTNERTAQQTTAASVTSANSAEGAGTISALVGRYEAADLSDGELKQVRVRLRSELELVDAALYARTTRREVGASWEQWEAQLAEAADPETCVAFALTEQRERQILCEGAASPTPRAIQRTAYWMAQEGWEERTVAESVFNAAFERGTGKDDAVEAVAAGLVEARRARRVDT